MRRLAACLAAVTCALAAPTAAEAGRFAVGLSQGADHAAVGRALQGLGAERVESLAPVRALVVDTDRPGRVAATPGVRYVEPIVRRRTAFTPTDPLVPRQWYLDRVRAFDAWEVLPPLASVRVAVIDSGVDLGHPDLSGRVAAARSFVGGSAADTSGHGTVVAGVIAARSQNGIGIAGLAPAAELLVAKVVEPDGTISVEAEARAIRWAIRRGARVINMSLGGVRDPSNPGNDTYSRLEADAVAFAVSRGAVVVAAVGNGDQAPAEPWRYAFYPAALPHVLGVSAVGRSGAVPGYSNRDPVYNDLAAPGADIVSTFPRRLTRERPTCREQGYTPCATPSFRPVDGTSFAAPLVSGAAATLLSLRPELRPEQVTGVLERTAVDADASTGCGRCAPGRDPFTGWGTLDVAAALGALEGPLPSVDALEANDDAGAAARFLSGTWRRRLVEATTDYWDDQDDVYAVYVRRGTRIDVVLRGDEGDLSLALWRPGSSTVQGIAHQRDRLRMSARSGPREYVGVRAEESGWHYVQVRMESAGEATYRLAIART
jgi:subtilisin family serine protease